ncbi:MAG TPA: prepilin-type N-terminal cleavage/methylation domain-containing protein [Sulfuricurvum sp.]|nr:prepilin-type N-terminal cleavage/methylation domain-containing protein [Sulfuricurvum sp.]
MKTKKAFTIIEVLLTIFLVGVMSTLGYYYISTSGLKQSEYKTTLQSQFNLIESMVFQCKNLSEQMPNQIGGADALDTNLTNLECNTSVPYAFDGGRNGFVPVPPSGFTAYTATESGTVFYITTTADNNSTQDKALQSLVLNYTSTQADLNHSATTATFKFYLSR